MILSNSSKMTFHLIININKMKYLGRLQLITGCMRSQKSTELIRRVRLYQVFTDKVLLVNSIVDSRSFGDVIETRDKQVMTAVKLKNITDIFVLENYQQFKVIAIDEAQFFPDLYDGVVSLLNQTDAVIIVAGLDGTSDQATFGQILQLQPHADHVVKLTAICQICNDGTPASFTICKQEKTNEILVGDDVYLSVCHKHISSYIKNRQLIIPFGNNPDDISAKFTGEILSQSNPQKINMEIIRITENSFYHNIHIFHAVSDMISTLRTKYENELLLTYNFLIKQLDETCDIYFTNSEVHIIIRNVLTYSTDKIIDVLINKN